MGLVPYQGQGAGVLPVAYAHNLGAPGGGYKLPGPSESAGEKVSGEGGCPAAGDSPQARPGGAAA